MSKELICYCYGDGTLEYTTDKDGVPEGALIVAKSPHWDKLRDTIEVLATHSYEKDDPRYFIGGVRTAEMMGEEPIDKMLEFKEYVNKAMNRA